MRAVRVIAQVMLVWCVLGIIPAYPGLREAEPLPTPDSVPAAPSVPVKPVLAYVKTDPVTVEPQQPAAKVEPAVPQGPPPTVNDAMALAAADLRDLPEYDRQYMRYIWVNRASTKAMQVASIVLNYISRSPVPVLATPLGKDRLMVIRVDTRDYAPEYRDFKEWLEAWEELRFDPLLNMLVTKDTLKFATGVDIPKQKKSVTKTKKVTDKAGKVHDEEYQETVDANGFDAGEDVIRIVAPHLDPAAVAYLVGQTRSQAPLVTFGYFLTRSLTTIQDSGVYKTVYGGLYYRFAGVPLAGKKGTDEDALFEQLGVGDVEKGLTAQFIYDNRVRSDQRLAVFHSGVTGKPRRVDMLNTLSSRPADSLSLILITHDTKAKNIDIGAHPLFNLQSSQDDAREILFTKGNGLIGYSLENGAGKRQDVVPADVTIDNTIPYPYRQELQPAISCIRCHAGEDGWRVVTNDVAKLTKELDIFGDKKDRDQVAGVNRLVGQYGGDFEALALPRLRADHARALYKSGGPWKESLKGQADTAKLSGKAIAELFAEHNYQRFGADQVLLDMGIEPPKNNDPIEAARLASELFKKSMAPPLVDEYGQAVESVRVGWLRVTGTLSRYDYDLEFGLGIAPRFKAPKQ